MTLSGAASAVRSASRPTPSRHRAARLAAIAAIFVAMAVAVSVWLVTAASGGPRLVVLEQPAGEVIYERTIETQETFVMEHTHSVTKRPVVETFSVTRAGTLAIEELWFDEFGPNLPAGPEVFDHDVTFLHEDGAWRVVHHSFAIGTLPLRVGGPNVDHVLTFSDKEQLRLLDITREGAWVELAVRE